MTNHKIVNREEWTDARNELLAPADRAKAERISLAAGSSPY
jgi:predicted dithiol-disulfide oxidoreductase (DUF899 family)